MSPPLSLQSMLLIALFHSDDYVVSRLLQQNMKTSSIITFLALSFLSFFVVTSDAKGLKHRTLGMMMSSKTSKKSSNSSKRSKTPLPPAPLPSPPPPPPGRRAPTCPETCEFIANKPFIGCNYLECIGNFECEKLNSIIPGQNGFKSQVQCDSYCVDYVDLSCPHGLTTTTSRCESARCIL
jgi:hypothetical protein